MLRRASVMSAVVVVGLLCLSGSVRSGRQEASLVLTGQVRVTSSLDGGATVVSIDTGNRPDGLVDHAFLVQTGAPFRLDVMAPGIVTFTKGRLSVAVKGSIGWVFSVPGKDAEPFSLSGDSAGVPVNGLSHYWGRWVGTSHDELAARLFSPPCSPALQQAGGCSDCETGGPGTSGCSRSCGSGECSADCVGGQYSCCSCSSGCRCCNG